jgi:MFS family permease
VVVVLLLAVIWAAVFVPPAVQAHAARREAFLVSFGAPPSGEVLPPVPASPRSARVQRRRRIAGGLLIAMAGTGLAGLLPTFRVLLVVHLFLLNSFIAYVALLAHLADRRARAAERASVVPDPGAVVDTGPVVVPLPRVRRRLPRPAILADLPPVASVG